MRLTKEQKEARKYFSKMPYRDFARDIKEQSKDGTEEHIGNNPVKVMRAAISFRDCGMMTPKTCQRIMDEAHQVIKAMDGHRVWE